MTETERLSHSQSLSAQLRWFLALRWIAAVAVVVGAVANILWLDWYERDREILIIGVFLFLYNFGLVMWWRRQIRRTHRASLFGSFTIAQIGVDLVLLTLLTVWTGGVTSPIIGFFIFHMVIASMLLPGSLAWTVGAFSIVCVVIALSLESAWPTTRIQWIAGAGWLATIFITIFIVNRITSDLSRQRRRLAWKNRRIRKMARRLEVHQNSIVQHEKAVTMGQMAAGIAHEIANPLANMDSLMQLMRRRKGEARTADLDRLADQIRRMNQIVQQMTEFAHQGESRRSDRNVNDLVLQAMQMVKFDRRLSRVEIVEDLDDSAGTVHVTPGAIVQVLINLILNALDALEEVENPRLVVSTTREDETFVAIRVADNGCGIPENDRELIFRPFYSTKPVGRGTGLGLSISRGLLEQNEGRIAVESEIGKGTTFTIHLPGQDGFSSRNRES